MSAKPKYISVTINTNKIGRDNQIFRSEYNEREKSSLITSLH